MDGGILAKDSSQKSPTSTLPGCTVQRFEPRWPARSSRLFHRFEVQQRCPCISIIDYYMPEIMQRIRIVVFCFELQALRVLKSRRLATQFKRSNWNILSRQECSHPFEMAISRIAGFVDEWPRWPACKHQSKCCMLVFKRRCHSTMHGHASTSRDLPPGKGCQCRVAPLNDEPGN
jgi:hypothetical protein